MQNQIKTVQHACLLGDSYARLTGKSLIDGLDRFSSQQTISDLLWNAPVAIVSHGVETDPIFNYGNALALKIFEYSWDAFTQLPSRLSAEIDQQEARAVLLAQVSKHGFFDGYHGIRVSKAGQRFKILDATVWNVLDANGVRYGQAAVIRNYFPFA